MMLRIALTFALLSTTAVAGLGDDKKTAAPDESGKQAALEAFKKLAGEWRGKEVIGHDTGMEVRVTYKVTSGGSAVVETLFPGTDHEMVTVIHPDGNELVLTHYCALGNQPQMRAPGKLEGNQVAFKFVRATNLSSEKAMYMRDAKFTFIDKDTLKSEWSHYQDGKPAGQVVFELKRQK
jgi:hypothetical protein